MKRVVVVLLAAMLSACATRYGKYGIGGLSFSAETRHTLGATALELEPPAKWQPAILRSAAAESAVLFRSRRSKPFFHRTIHL